MPPAPAPGGVVGYGAEPVAEKEKRKTKSEDFLSLLSLSSLSPSLRLRITRVLPSALEAELSH
jgi:hypothetical protein